MSASSDAGAPRRIRYQVAASLDGFIAGPGGEADWIVPEPTFDFAAHFAQFDTFLVGRRTYEAMKGMGGGGTGGKTLVFSTTLRPEDAPGLEVVGGGVEGRLRALRAEPGKDIWLFGGGGLFRSLLGLGQVDTVEVKLIPVLLGGGIPLLATPAERQALQLVHHETYPSGMILLEYAVARAQRAPRRRSRSVEA